MKFMSKMSMQSFFSEPSPSSSTRLKVETISQRRNPASISPRMTEEMSQMNIPHSHKRPAAMPNQAPIFDKLNSKIPAPPVTNYVEFLEWLGNHFAMYFSKEFEHFLLDKMKLLSIQDLADFMTYLDPKVLHDSLGPVMYDRFRESIVDLKVIWSFLQMSFSDGQSNASYSAFLSHRKDNTGRVATLFPSSTMFKRPTPAYRTVSPVVANSDSSQKHEFLDSHFFQQMCLQTLFFVRSQIFRPHNTNQVLHEWSSHQRRRRLQSTAGVCASRVIPHCS